MFGVQGFFTFLRPYQPAPRQNARTFCLPYQRTWLENMLEDNLPTLECLKDKIQHRQVDEVSNKLPLYKPQAANITVQQTKRHVQLQIPKILVSFHQSKTYNELT
jgi:hypothetical protein